MNADKSAEQCKGVDRFIVEHEKFKITAVVVGRATCCTDQSGADGADVILNFGILDKGAVATHFQHNSFADGAFLWCRKYCVRSIAQFG